MSMREAVGGLVAAGAVLLQGLHHDPVQLPADQFRQSRRFHLPAGGQRRQRLAGTQPRAWPRRLFLADDAADLVPGRFLEPLLLQRRRAGQQLVEQYAQRIDVGAGVDVEVIELRLFRRHVERRAQHRLVRGVQRPLRQRLVHRLGQAEVDHLGHRPVVVGRDEDVRGLQVAVNDALLMGVLDGLADLHEQVQAARRTLIRVASQYSVIGTPLTYSMTK